jgi:hypothetical protein
VCRRDCMGEKILARNLLSELWNQVNKYRKHGKTKMLFDLHLGKTSFKDWYNDYTVRSIKAEWIFLI